MAKLADAYTHGGPHWVNSFIWSYTSTSYCADYGICYPLGIYFCFINTVALYYLNLLNNPDVIIVIMITPWEPLQLLVWLPPCSGVGFPNWVHWAFLTHWGGDKMAAIFEITIWNAFSWMKMYEFQLIFHWSLFLRVQLTIFHHWFR